MHASLYTTTAGERSARAYSELKRQLLAGELPFGRRLGEEALAAALGVSRTPVREALSRLHAEALVARHPGGGFEPAAPDLHRSRELYEVRFALELDALERPRRLGRAHDRAVLIELRAEWAALRTTEIDALGDLGEKGACGVDSGFVLQDEAFHVRLAMAAGNASAVEMLVRVNERIRPVRVYDFRSVDRLSRTVDQHVAVLDAILEGELDSARSLLTAHFDESLAVVEACAAQALVRMVNQLGALDR